MKSFLTIICLLIGVFQFSKACSCLFIDNFCESIADENGVIWPGFNIHLVEVKIQNDNGISVEIIKTLHGNDMAGSSLFIINGIEADCRRRTTDYEVGKQYIFTVYFADNIWAVPFCGISWLDVNDGIVSGAIADGVTQLSFEEFEDLTLCTGTTGVDEPGRLGVRVLPTLASGHVRVEALETTGLPSLDLRVYDAQGRLVLSRQDLPLEKGNPVSLDVADWRPGVYFFLLFAGNRQAVVRIVKV